MFEFVKPCAANTPQGSRVRPNFSRVRLKKNVGRTGASSHSKKKKKSLRDSKSLLFDNRHVRLIAWSKPIRDSEVRTPLLIGRGPDIPVCVCVWRCVCCCCCQTEIEVSSRDARSSFSEFDLFSERLTVTPGFCDRWIYRKIKQSPLFSKLPQILHLDASFDVIAFSQRKVVSRFKKWNEQLCVLFMPDLQELHRTNEPKAEQIRGTRLGYRPFICSDRSRGLLSITLHRYTQRWEIQWIK